MTATYGAFNTSALITPDTQTGNLRSLTLNGDGLQDLAVWVQGCAAYYGSTCLGYTLGETLLLVAQPSGTFTSISGGGWTGTPGSVMFANVNNDACTDVIYNQSQVYLSPCNNSGWGYLTTTYPVVAEMDWNGDGLSDLIESSGGTLYVQLSTATGLGTATALSVPYASNCAYTALDANGDGLDDFGCISSTSGTNGFTYYPHNGAGTPRIF